MSRMVKSLVVGAALLAFSAPANAAAAGGPPVRPAEGLVMWHDLSLEMAKTVAEATLAECRSKGFHTAAVVVDRSGQVIVTLRDELATPQMMEMARRKAYTARMFRTATADWAKRTRDDPAVAPQRDLPEVLALAGGEPIKVGDETIGAVGSSGSSLAQDDSCAKAGVAKVAHLLK